MTGTIAPAPPETAHGPMQSRLLRMARLLTARPKTVLAVWVLVIAVCFPFASQLNDVLTKQGASKLVPGTSSARADQLIERSFPHRSQRESIVVIAAPDVRSSELRSLLAELDTRIAERVRTGDVRQSSSAYTLYRDLTADFLRGLRARLDQQGVPADPAARSAAVDAAVTAGQLPAGLTALAKAAVAAGDQELTGLAGKFVRGADWRAFPLPVPPEAVGRLVAEDGRAALVSVSFTGGAGHDPDVDWLRAAVKESAEAANAGPGVATHVTGELALIHDTYKQAEDDNALMETVAYAIILVVLLLFFRALVPAVLTLLAIGLATTVSQAALFALGHGVTLTQFTITIMNFVMLGAGVDYSMLLSSRYRQERLAGRPPREAAVHATAHAGESMLLAAVAVVLAFGATLFSPVDWIPPLGYGGLIGIPIVLLAALTLTPSLLTLLGDRFFALGRRPLSDLEHESALGRHLARAADLARRRRVAIVLVFAVVTIPFAVLTAQHRSTADPVALSPATDSRAGFELIAKEWGNATVLPTLIVARPAAGVVTGRQLTEQGQRLVTGLTDRIAAVPGVARVDAVTRPFGTPLPADQVAALPADLRRDYLADDGSLRIVVELGDPPYSEAAVETVDRLQAVAAAATEVGGLEVGGATQVDRQYGAALTDSFWQMIGLVSVGVFVMLVIALRSLLIPIRLILTIMMSNVWAIGLTVLIFHFWLDRAIIDDLPIFLTVLMMGLGMDYEIFLVTRVRDLVRGGADQEAATIGAVVDTGRVINAAGLVMAGSLGTMALSSTIMLQEYGVGLGLAVLLDATLIRMLFVPATLLLFRRYNWWMPTLRRRPSPAKAG
ncbi:RND superfamily putative drug exporter [Kitasatospora gansuensis]|uniref:RND superfamily putative drug exporter n=1 Tax=Kitasatospora gansuensis TaxID=258050 RepID=A0A7W7S752_9ACTN|nr:MMPL family transporter [Kitasatospora gansuensis]MBB4945084.1 RND superfamily putative drug exporter [Kitasatospora gansuensis]